MTLQIQIAINAMPERIFEALTTSAQVVTWFAEKADISLEENRYDFWGRFTLGAPTHEEGKHSLLAYETNKCLKFQWHYQESESIVAFYLEPRENGALLILKQDVAPGSHNIGKANFEDFWFLSLENLRRFIDGREVVARCDFSAIKPGDFSHSIEIDAPSEDVFGALIRPEQLNRWIASNAVVEPVAGGKYEFGWNGFTGVKILEIKPNDRLVIRWPETNPETKEVRESVVTWTLEGSGGKTRLTIVHSGFAPDTPTDGIQAGWLNFINWIKSMLEYGIAWQPPYSRLSVNAYSFYAASIVDAQKDIVTAYDTTS